MAFAPLGERSLKGKEEDHVGISCSKVKRFSITQRGIRRKEPS